MEKVEGAVGMKMKMKMMQYYHLSNPLSLSNNTLLKKIDCYMVLTHCFMHVRVPL